MNTRKVLPVQYAKRQYRNYQEYRHEQRIKKLIIGLTAFTAVLGAATCLANTTEAESRDVTVDKQPVQVRVVREEPVQKAQETEMVPVPMTPLGEYKVVGYDPYCTHCCPRGDGITASGVPATVGRTCAIEGLPFGTKLYISGLGEYVVEDRGVKGNVIDIACADHAACYAITGTYEVYIVNEPVPADEFGI